MKIMLFVQKQQVHSIGYADKTVLLLIDTTFFVGIHINYNTLALLSLTACGLQLTITIYHT